MLHLHCTCAANRILLLRANINSLFLHSNIAFLKASTRSYYVSVLPFYKILGINFGMTLVCCDIIYLSQSITVFNLCAIVNTVHFWNSVLMAFWIILSVSKSMAAVASSRIKIFVLRNKARAKHTSCR